MPVFPEIRGQRQEDWELKVSLKYRRLCLKNNNNKKFQRENLEPIRHRLSVSKGGWFHNLSIDSKIHRWSSLLYKITLYLHIIYIIFSYTLNHVKLLTISKTLWMLCSFHTTKESLQMFNQGVRFQQLICSTQNEKYVSNKGIGKKWLHCLQD